MTDPRGYLCLTLHAHLPFIRHPEYPDFLEEDWLYEAITETYVPLLDMMERLARDGVHFRISMSLTPPLCNMLSDELLMGRYRRKIDNLVELMEKELHRTRSLPEPFQRTARMMIMCDASRHAVTGHRDHSRTEVSHEFVWFRTNLDKPFWVQDVRAERPKLYLTSYSAWFDTVNQFHGADPVDKLSISVRVDGRFTDELRARIPPAPSNRASRAALWAALAGEGREAGEVR